MLVPNVIEVKTPPPPMYEEEMEEQKRLEAQPKYNKELYASSESELSSIESENEDDSDNAQGSKKAAAKKPHKKKKKKRKGVSKNITQAAPQNQHLHSNELRLPEITPSKRGALMSDYAAAGGVVQSTKASKVGSHKSQHNNSNHSVLGAVNAGNAGSGYSGAAAGGAAVQTKDRITVHSIRSLASELLVPKQDHKV